METSVWGVIAAVLLFRLAEKQENASEPMCGSEALRLRISEYNRQSESRIYLVLIRVYYQDDYFQTFPYFAGPSAAIGISGGLML